MVELDDLRADPSQPRKTFDGETLAGMAKSMAKHGLIVPVEVDDANQIVLGERRWRAARLANLKHIPAVVRENLNPVDKLERQLIEDVHHEAIPLLEKAAAWGRLRQYHGTALSAKILGVTPEHFNRVANMTELSDEVKEKVDRGQITGRTARVLTSIKDKELEKELARKIAEERLSPKEAERIVPLVKRATPTVRKELLRANSVITPDIARKILEIPEEKEQRKIIDEIKKRRLSADEIGRRVDIRKSALEAKEPGARNADATSFIEEVLDRIDAVEKVLRAERAANLSGKQKEKLARDLRTFAEGKLFPFLKVLTGQNEYVSAQ